MTESIVTPTVEAGFRPNSLLDYALAYASIGLRILPVHSRSKKPMLNEWPKLASSDPAQVTQWFAGVDCNVGIAAGPGSGVVVLDVDTKNDGPAHLAALEERYGPLPDTWTAETGTKGRHLFFRVPAVGDRRLTNRTRLGGTPGLDFKTEGGFVVAAPSVNESGGIYSWLPGKAPWECELADMPEWLLSIILRNPSKPPGGRSGGTPNSPGAILEGGRNDTLFHEARRLHARELDETAILAVIRQMNVDRCDPPLDDDEVQRLVRSAMNYDPFAMHPVTETGIGRRLVSRFGEDIRYAAGAKAWWVWDGTHWEPDPHVRLEAMVKEVVDELYESCKLVEPEKLREKMQAAVRRLMAHGKIRGAINCAASEPEISIALQDLDRDDTLLNVANGTVDLATGILHPHRKDDLLTRKIGIDYRADAPRELWDRFLLQIFKGDEEVVRYVQTCFGYMATARMDEQSMFLLVGGGANGKSTLLGTIEKVLGPYAGPAPAKTFLAKSNDNGVGDDLVHLAGKRLVSISETGAGKRFDSALVKQITGGDSVNARALYGRYGTIRSTMKLVLATNHRPRLESDDPALWRRMRLIPFEVIVPAEKQDPELGRKLWDEREGVLAWIIEGAWRWLGQGRLVEPPAIKAATEAYRHESDVVGLFLEERCEQGPGYRARLQKLFHSFRDWCSLCGHERLPQGRFNARLEALGFRKRRGPDGFFWESLREKEKLR